LVDNGSEECGLAQDLRELGRAGTRTRVTLVPYDVRSIFRASITMRATQASGSYLLFLNNDTEVIAPDWIDAMVEQAQRPSVGAVGAKLLYEDGTVQHGGVIIGLGGVAGHSHKYSPGGEPGYFGSLQTVNNYSAVTAACLMVRRGVFEELGGFDEDLAIAFNDVRFLPANSGRRILQRLLAARRAFPLRVEEPRARGYSGEGGAFLGRAAGHAGALGDRPQAGSPLQPQPDPGDRGFRDRNLGSSAAPRPAACAGTGCGFGALSAPRCNPDFPWTPVRELPPPSATPIVYPRRSRWTA